MQMAFGLILNNLITSEAHLEKKRFCYTYYKRVLKYNTNFYLYYIHWNITLIFIYITYIEI